jgi:transposase
MVPFGPCSTVAAGEGIHAAWLEPGIELDPQLVARASRLQAVSMDMTGGYAKSVREHAPQAEIVIDNYHVVAVRHEALPVRAGCETPPPGCRGSPGKLRAV